MKRFRRRLPPGQEHLRKAAESLAAVVGLVERAKASLVSAAPTGRRSGAPLAGALSGFEHALRKARGAMAGWRTPEVEEAWRSCEAGLVEAERRAEELRLEQDVPDGYEQLYGLLGDLMEPLSAFETAVARFRDLGL